MAWVKLDDGFPEHPKVEKAGDRAGWLYICALAYASRTLSDGFIPESRVPRLTNLPKPRDLAERLVAQGLWDRIDGGYQIHDYEQHQMSKREIEQRRKANAERVKRHRVKAARESLYATIYERDVACVQCGAMDDLTIDHIVPLSRGGTTEEKNLQVLCRPCNSAKRNALHARYGNVHVLGDREEESRADEEF